jgi:hypothetical protein
MAAEDSNVDYWSLSPAQLAVRIGSIARAEPSAVDASTRAEASQLAEEWHEAMNMPKATFEDQERQVAQLDSLQKRIIEILVRTSRNS